MPICPSCEADVDEGAKFCTHCGASVPRTKQTGEDPLLGRIFARNFRIEKLLGVGGMGKVYKAIQLSLDKPVVLKLLHPHYANDETLVHRFHREARAASRLNHPNSINIIDFGQDDDGTLFMAMEFLNGRDLFTVLQDEFPLGEKRVAHILIQVCSALADAHEQGVIHRDLKPENIMVEDRRAQRDYVKVLDFGIAKIQDPGGKETRALTAQGMVCGTPEYMAPEQARGDGLDATTDIYALGVLLYQLTTGQLPFQADNAIGIVTKHIVEKPKPPREAYPNCNVTEEMEFIILKCMEKKNEDRYANVISLAEALTPIAERPSGTMTEGAGLGTATQAATDLVNRNQGAPATTGPATTGPATTGPATTGPATTGPATTGGEIDAPKSKVGLFAGIGAAVLVLGSMAVIFAVKGGEWFGGEPTKTTDAHMVVVATKPDAGGRPDRGETAVVVADVDAGKKPNTKPPKKVDAGGKAAAKDPSATEISDVDRDMIKSFLQKGKARLGAGDYEEALVWYRKVKKIDPNHIQNYWLLGNAAYGAGKTEEACKSWRQFLKRTPKKKRAAYTSFVDGRCR